MNKVWEIIGIILMTPFALTASVIVASIFIAIIVVGAALVIALSPLIAIGMALSTTGAL